MTSNFDLKNIFIKNKSGKKWDGMRKKNIKKYQ